jgi:hypothetical protein
MILRRNPIPTLRTNQDHLIPSRDPLNPSNIHHRLVHRNPPHKRCPHPPHQHPSLPSHSPLQTIRIPHRQQRHKHRLRGNKRPVVPHHRPSLNRPHRSHPGLPRKHRQQPFPNKPHRLRLIRLKCGSKPIKRQPRPHHSPHPKPPSQRPQHPHRRPIQNRSRIPDMQPDRLRSRLNPRSNLFQHPSQPRKLPPCHHPIALIRGKQMRHHPRQPHSRNPTQTIQNSFELQRPNPLAAHPRIQFQMHRDRPGSNPSRPSRLFQLANLPSLPDHRRQPRSNHRRPLPPEHPANHQNRNIPKPGRITNQPSLDPLLNRSNPQPPRPSPHRRRPANLHRMPISIRLHNRQQLHRRRTRSTPALPRQQPVIPLKSIRRNLNPTRPSDHKKLPASILPATAAATALG